jgi:hypothetical protein
MTNMEKIEKAARAAYELDSACAARVPWDILPNYWKDYWRNIAKAVFNA